MSRRLGNAFVKMFGSITTLWIRFLLEFAGVSLRLITKLLAGPKPVSGT
jgi:hypothetical protein